MKKKLLFIMPNLSSGGAEKMIVSIINNIDKESNEVELLLFRSDINLNFYLKDLNEDIIIHYLNSDKKLRYLFFKLHRKIKEINPNIIFVGQGILFMILYKILFYFSLKNIKFIAREILVLSESKNIIRKILCKLLYNTYDRIISQSNDMSYDLIHNYRVDEDKIQKINNFIDNDKVDNKLQEEMEVSLPKDKINLIACGRLTYQKGFDMLIESFNQLKFRNKYHLTILGKGDNKDIYNQEKLLKDKVLKYNISKEVTFLGVVDNPYKYFEKADIFILSSRYEGFPNVLIESLYCGIPALANNCLGGINEIMINGENGYIFDFKKDDFEEKLNLIINANFNKDKIKDTITSRFSKKIIMNLYNNLLDQV